MARPLRLELAGGLHHVTSRGNARSAIYLDDDDRLNWLALLNDVCSRFNWICHAYCLMSNHYHVVVETVAGNLSKDMRQLNGVYTQNFNRRHQQVGHVFQGRYKAILVEKDSYLLELSRYVVLNPVRAGMVNDVADWLLSQFDSNQAHARIHYRNFVRAGIGLPPVWDNLNNQIFLGNKDFVDRLQSQIKAEPHKLKEIPKAQRRPLGQPLHFYVETFPSPKVGMQKAYETGDYTMQQIADAFGVHYATVSRAVNSHSLKNI